MRKIVCSLLVFAISGLSYASIPTSPVSVLELEKQNVDMKDVEVIESAEDASDVTIKDIKAYLKTADLKSTCLDEMLARRRQLIIKLALTPITAPLLFGGSIFIGSISGSYLGALNNPPGGWGDLAGAVTGIFLGGLGSIIYVGADTTISTLKLIRLNLLVKTLGEQYLDRPGKKTDKFYHYYLKNTQTGAMDMDSFIREVKEHDASGAFCDGSMLKKKRFHFGSKLKYKVANAKDFVKHLNSKH
jgi:hypothetical protein